MAFSHSLGSKCGVLAFDDIKESYDYAAVGRLDAKGRVLMVMRVVIIDTSPVLHLLIACPPIRGPCLYGVNLPALC